MLSMSLPLRHTTTGLGERKHVLFGRDAASAQNGWVHSQHLVYYAFEIRQGIQLLTVVSLARKLVLTSSGDRLEQPGPRRVAFSAHRDSRQGAVG